VIVSRRPVPAPPAFSRACSPLEKSPARSPHQRTRCVCRRAMQPMGAAPGKVIWRTCSSNVPRGTFSGPGRLEKIRDRGSRPDTPTESATMAADAYRAVGARVKKWGYRTAIASQRRSATPTVVSSTRFLTEERPRHPLPLTTARISVAVIPAPTASVTHASGSDFGTTDLPFPPPAAVDWAGWRVRLRACRLYPGLASWGLRPCSATSSPPSLPLRKPS
jgi:hypothetical protein